jgi:hypothetical protein
MGLTRITAQQISDIDYKQAVRVITLGNITLSGGAPAAVDGVSLSLGDRILVAGQNTGSQNGLYYVTTVGTGSTGTWARSKDGDVTGEILAGMIVMVTEGITYADTQWKLITNDPIIVGTTALTFTQNSVFAFGNVYANSTAILATTVGDSLTLTAGNNISITGNTTSKSVTISSTASGGNSNSITNGTSNVSITNSGGNVTVGVGGTDNVAVFATNGVYVTANVSALNFNSVSADLAENYVADQDYPIGTLLMIGGANEVRDSQLYHDPKVVGTVSDKPAYIMNSGLTAKHVVTVALLGRVPCRVVGTIARGDLLASSNVAGVATALNPDFWVPGCVIGKALDKYSGDEPGVIEIIVGRY